MIQVKVRYAGLPRSETGRSEETWELSEEATLQELVELICQKYRWPMEEKNDDLSGYPKPAGSR